MNNNECPEPEPGCDFEAVEEAKELWKTLKASPQTPQVFTIPMEQIAPFGENDVFMPLRTVFSVVKPKPNK